MSEPLILQLAAGSDVSVQLAAVPPPSVTSGRVVIEHTEPDGEGNLEPPDAGEVVLSVPSPEALARQADDVRRVIEQAGTGAEPLVIVVEAAEEFRDDELHPVLEALAHTERQVILRVIRDA
ncbi:MAG TPA: hypothetical protein VGH24_10300 [Solirubrobacteraceae bacterium]